MTSILFERIKPGTVVDSFRFDYPIGSGGFGVVWQGYHQVMDQSCAIKVIDTYKLDKQSLKRVERECAIGGKLTEAEHIVRVHHAFFKNDMFFIVMELMSSSLDRYLRDYPHPDFDLTLTWVLDLCKALQAAHAKNVIHRDIKPQNILLTADQRVKLSDFGVAHLPTTSALTTHTQPGTPGYRSPEQEANQTVDGSTDVYALCAVFFEVWIGRQYFSFRNIDRDIVREEMKLALQEHYPQLKPSIRAQLMQMVLAGLTPQVERISLNELEQKLISIRAVYQRTSKFATDFTFVDHSYFAGLDERTVEVTLALQLGRDEAGPLDKKLDPDLLHTTGTIIDLLHQPEHQAEAQRELIGNNEPDLAIAILRQAFRVRNDQVRDWLVRRLIELAQSDQAGLVHAAIKEATGSHLLRLSQLADKAFLEVATEAEAIEVATDPLRTHLTRIRACQLLVERHHNVVTVGIALNLFKEC